MKSWSYTAKVAALGVFAACTGAAIAEAQTADSYWQDIQKRGVLRCGAAAAPPHVIRDPQTGAYSGTFVDLCREFAEQALGVKVEIVDTTWDNIVAGLQAGRWDLSMALNQTPKRAMAITFSEPAWHYQITIVYDKANPKLQPAPKSLDDLDRDGISMAVMSGTAQEQSLTARIKTAALVRLPDVDATRLALSSHRADVLVDDGDTNALFAATDPKRWATLVPSPAISKQGMSFGLRRTASYADVQVLNFFIEEKAAIGEIQAIGQGYINKLAGTK